MSVSITDQVYVVTGASSGFGLAMAKAIVDAGGKVGLLARRAEKLQEAVAELGADKAFAVSADVADSAAVNKAMVEVHGHYGRLDGLVNNAGVAAPAFADTYTDEEIQAHLQVNIAGLMYCTRAAIPLMADSPNPRIVNISSASAEHHDEMQGLSLYAASKAAVERLTRDTRREMQEKNIGVTILRPGAAMTDFAAGWDFDKLKAALDVWNSRQGQYMDLGMEPEHVAEAAVFCLGMDPGVSVDVLEIRPNRLSEKMSL